MWSGAFPSMLVTLGFAPRFIRSSIISTEAAAAAAARGAADPAHGEVDEEEDTTMLAEGETGGGGGGGAGGPRLAEAKALNTTNSDGDNNEEIPSPSGHLDLPTTTENPLKPSKAPQAEVEEDTTM